MTELASIPYAIWILDQEARALLNRLSRVKPFALHETMVPAAGISPAAQTAIENFLLKGRRELRERIESFLEWLLGTEGRRSTPSASQRRFTLLRLKFNAVLTQFDLFADVLTQRSEHETGVWLAGLDVVAADALALPGYYQAPPVICYLDRGVGAAIRRARTRLPGGGENPCAIVRVPRERMVGSGIASSLVHEVGHQAAAILDLINSLRPILQERGQVEAGKPENVWRFWERWISEILADFWSVARVGVGSTLGLMGVVSLPRAFVFRINLDDPHPFPWIRVKISCAIGQALYPHPQWQRLERVWESFYPVEGLDEARQGLLGRLQAGLPEFLSLLINHRPPSLNGRSIIEAMEVNRRSPQVLASYRQSWQAAPGEMLRAPPSLVFAVIGQAKADGRLEPKEEGELLSKLLTHWALRSTLNASAHVAALSRSRDNLIIN